MEALQKEKLKHVKFNLIWAIPEFGIILAILLIFFNSMNIFIALAVAFYFYLHEVKEASNLDYLNEKNKNLEKRIQGLEKLNK